MRLNFPASTSDQDDASAGDQDIARAWNGMERIAKLPADQRDFAMFETRHDYKPLGLSPEDVDGIDASHSAFPQLVAQRGGSVGGAASNAALARVHRESAGTPPPPNRQPIGQLHVSADAAKFIKGWEQYGSKAYLDSAQHPTIGWGHLMTPADRYPNGIKDEEAERLFQADLAAKEAYVKSRITAPLSQREYDALVSLAYNLPAAIGVQAKGKPTTLRDRLNAGDYAAAADQFALWRNITRNGKLVPEKGLEKRRAAEMNIFSNGIYDSSH